MRLRTYDWDLVLCTPKGRKIRSKQFLKQTLPGMMYIAQATAIRNPNRRVKMKIASRYYPWYVDDIEDDV
jgi:hypothetical protein